MNGEDGCEVESDCYYQANNVEPDLVLLIRL